MYKYLVILLLLLSGCSDPEKQFQVGDCIWFSLGYEEKEKNREPWQEKEKLHIYKLAEEGKNNWRTDYFSKVFRRFLPFDSIVSKKDILLYYSKIECPVESKEEVDQLILDRVKTLNNSTNENEILEDNKEIVEEFEETEEIKEESDALPPLEPLKK
jgi:hypothetical protein